MYGGKERRRLKRHSRIVAHLETQYNERLEKDAKGWKTADVT